MSEKQKAALFAKLAEHPEWTEAERLGFAAGFGYALGLAAAKKAQG